MSMQPQHRSSSHRTFVLLLSLCAPALVSCFGSDEGSDKPADVRAELARVYLEVGALCDKQRDCRIADPFFCDPSNFTPAELERATNMITHDQATDCLEALTSGDECLLALSCDRYEKSELQGLCRIDGGDWEPCCFDESGLEESCTSQIECQAQREQQVRACESLDNAVYGEPT